MERLDAFFKGHAYSAHRHDSYAIGLTLRGVQCFHYRGEKRASLYGNVILLNPDELHDGESGIEEGFRYRMVYLRPDWIADALSDRARALPMPREPIGRNGALARLVATATADLDQPLDPLEQDNLVTDFADALLAWDPSAGNRGLPPALHRPALDRARQLLTEECGRAVRAQELEAVTGLDRHLLNRQFRCLFATSPYRFLMQRRLDRARQCIADGASLVEAALDAGFADQAHFCRQFSAAFGMPPGRWKRLSRPASTQ